VESFEKDVLATILAGISRQPTRTDGRSRQLCDLLRVAEHLGMVDAAAVLQSMLPDVTHAWQTPGITCTYYPARSLAAGPGPFQAKILSFTPGGRARIRAFDPASGEWHRATVDRGCLHL
jgi:hypothetical protein